MPRISETARMANQSLDLLGRLGTAEAALKIATDALEEVIVAAAPIYAWRNQNDIVTKIQSIPRKALDEIKKLTNAKN